MTVTEFAPRPTTEFTVTRVMREGPPKEIVCSFDRKLLQRPQSLYMKYLNGAERAKADENTPTNEWLDRANIELHHYLKTARMPDADVRSDAIDTIWETMVALNRGLIEKFAANYAHIEGVDSETSQQNALWGFRNAVETWIPRRASLLHHARLHIRREVQRDEILVRDRHFRRMGYMIDELPNEHPFEENRFDEIDNRLSPDPERAESLEKELHEVTRGIGVRKMARDIFRLHVLGYDNDEIAEKVGTKPGSVTWSLESTFARIRDKEEKKSEPLETQASIHQSATEQVLNHNHAVIPFGEKTADFSFIDGEYSTFIIRPSGSAATAARPTYNNRGQITQIEYQVPNEDSVARVTRTFPQPLPKDKLYQTILHSVARMTATLPSDHVELDAQESLIATKAADTIATLDRLKAQERIPEGDRMKRSIIDLQNGRIRINMHLIRSDKEGAYSAVQTLEVVRPAKPNQTSRVSRMIVWTPSLVDGAQQEYHVVRTIESPGQITVESSHTRLKPEDYEKALHHAMDRIGVVPSDTLGKEGTLPHDSPLLTNKMKWKRTDSRVWDALRSV